MKQITIDGVDYNLTPVTDTTEQTSYHFDLFRHMKDNHNLILLGSELDEIISVVNKIQQDKDGFVWTDELVQSCVKWCVRSAPTIEDISAWVFIQEFKHNEKNKITSRKQSKEMGDFAQASKSNKQPLDKVSNDWEIVSWKGDGCIVYGKDFPSDNNFEIHSVKRLSDGELLSVGSVNDFGATLKKFYTTGTGGKKMIAVFGNKDGSEEHWEINLLQPLKTPTPEHPQQTVLTPITNHSVFTGSDLGFTWYQFGVSKNIGDKLEVVKMAIQKTLN